MYNLCSLPKPGRFKCEKTVPQEFDERLYMVALDSKKIFFKRNNFCAFLSFLLFDTNGCHDCSLYINYLENV